jgi:hypothetical protein
MKGREKRRCQPPISTTYAAVAEKLDEDYLACIVSATALRQTRLQFSREVAAFPVLNATNPECAPNGTPVGCGTVFELTP